MTRADIFGDMPVKVEMQNIGDPGVQTEVGAVIEHALADRAGDWRVSILGSQAHDLWEMKVFGPNHFERSYTLDGAAGEREPRVIGQIVGMMLPK